MISLNKKVKISNDKEIVLRKLVILPDMMKTKKQKILYQVNLHFYRASCQLMVGKLMPAFKKNNLKVKDTCRMIHKEIKLVKKIKKY